MKKIIRSNFRRGKKFAIPRKCKECDEISERVTFYKKYDCLLCDKHYQQIKRHGKILWKEWVKITPLTRRIRHSEKNKEWRKKVYERDDYTCQICFDRGVYLEADHYPKTFSEIFHSNKIETFEQAMKCKEFWNIKNGRTLCAKCHRGNKAIHFDIVNKKHG